MSSTRNLGDLRRRLDKLEVTVSTAQPREVRRFMVQGPADLSTADAIAFLREQGHSIEEHHHNIILTVIGADNGCPLGLPLMDRTPRLTAVSPLYLQPDAGR